jgi:hypothetical protein
MIVQNYKNYLYQFYKYKTVTEVSNRYNKNFIV